MLPTVDMQLDEGVPLMCNHATTADCGSFEMAPIHTPKSSFEAKGMPSVHGSPSKVTRKKDRQNFTDRVILSVYDRVNVIEALHAFWQKKQASSSLGTDSQGLVVFMSEPSVGTPCVCYVTLPGGCCFASPRDCASSAEARRSAAHVALVNSVFNELPSRRITESFIANAVREASLSCVPVSTAFATSDEACDQSGIDAYQFVLESAFSQSVLDLTALVNKLRIMHWSGALRAMNVRGATRQDVLRAALSEHWVSEDCRSEMALGWIAVERRSPGSINTELKKADAELQSARRCGRELAFPRLKRDVLQLAASLVQLNAPTNSSL